MPGPGGYYQPEQSYQGYGLPNPQAPGPMNPRLMLEECLEALRTAFDGKDYSPVPWVSPGYRAADRCDFVRAVVNIPAAIDPIANAAGLVLAAANSTLQPITVLTPTGAASNPVTLFTLTVPRGSVLKVRSWGITVVNNAPEAITVLVRGGTAGGLSSPPNPNISSHQTELHQPAHMILTEDKTLDLQISNVSPDALLLNFSICYWLFPVTNYTDDPRTTRLTPGYGERC